MCLLLIKSQISEKLLNIYLNGSFFIKQTWAWLCWCLKMVNTTYSFWQQSNFQTLPLCLFKSLKSLVTFISYSNPCTKHCKQRWSKYCCLSSASKYFVKHLRILILQLLWAWDYTKLKEHKLSMLVSELKYVMLNYVITKVRFNSRVVLYTCDNPTYLAPMWSTNMELQNAISCITLL